MSAPSEGTPGTAIAARLTGVEKAFEATGGTTLALTGIDLAIGKGDFLSLIGPSGCGKSTLLRILGDLITPTAGSVEVNGKPAHQARLDRDYGMVFQAPVLFDWRTVEANVRLPLEVMGVGRQQRDRKVRQMLDLVELGGFLRHYPHQLSGGMQQRVAIARALTFEPALLLMDEPFGALDEMTRERLNAEVLRIWAETGTTIVFVTHSIPEAVFLSTRVVVMSARPGRIAEVIDIDLPQPRDESTRETPRYYELVTRVRESLRGRRDEGAAGGPVDGGSSARLRAEGAFGVSLSSEPLAEPGRRLPSRALIASRVLRYLPALVVFVVFLLIWELMTTGHGRRVIPPPSAVLRALTGQTAVLWAAARTTYYEALGGLFIGTVAGVSVAFATARWATARDVLLPVAIGASAIPLVAAAPIIINWFGLLDPLSMMMMAALLVFFPITINVTRGLMQVQPAALELMRSYASTPTQVLRKVRIPNMLPFFFTALKVSTTLAFIGAIVGEYFGGASRVIGKVVMSSMANGSFDLAWAGIVIGACGAIVAYLVVSLVERFTIPWYAALRSGQL